MEVKKNLEMYLGFIGPRRPAIAWENPKKVLSKVRESGPQNGRETFSLRMLDKLRSTVIPGEVGCLKPENPHDFRASKLTPTTSLQLVYWRMAWMPREGIKLPYLIPTESTGLVHLSNLGRYIIQ